MLRPGSVFIFNVWNRIEENPVSSAVAGALAGIFPDDPPSFLQRIPFGYHNKGRIDTDLREAGFQHIASETVERRSRIGSAREAAFGLCHGTPLRAEIESRGGASLEQATETVTAALSHLETGNGIDAPMSAQLFTARA